MFPHVGAIADSFGTIHIPDSAILPIAQIYKEFFIFPTNHPKSRSVRPFLRLHFMPCDGRVLLIYTDEALRYGRHSNSCSGKTCPADGPVASVYACAAPCIPDCEDLLHVDSGLHSLP